MWGMQERVLILALNSSLPTNLSSTFGGVWLIKCRQGSKTHKSIYQFWKKLTFDWIVENPSQDLFGQRPQDTETDVLFPSQRGFHSELLLEVCRRQ
jgi:hypothetical protein